MNKQLFTIAGSKRDSSNHGELREISVLYDVRATYADAGVKRAVYEAIRDTLCPVLAKAPNGDKVVNTIFQDWIRVYWRGNLDRTITVDPVDVHLWCHHDADFHRQRLTVRVMWPANYSGLVPNMVAAHG